MVLHHNYSIYEIYSMFNEVCVEIFLEISWKSWGEGLQKLYEVSITSVNPWNLWFLCLIIMQNNHTNILMNNMLTVHGLPKKYFWNTVQDSNILIMSKYGTLQKNLYQVRGTKKSKGYFDARTEFDFKPVSLFISDVSDMIQRIWLEPDFLSSNKL